MNVGPLLDIKLECSLLLLVVATFLVMSFLQLLEIYRLFVFGYEVLSTTLRTFHHEIDNRISMTLRFLDATFINITISLAVCDNC